MSCRKAFEVDLVDFLTQPGGAAFADFRDHYPRCRECSAEVRAWTELDLQLRSGAPEQGAGHPQASMLARYEEGAEGLAPLERTRVERHLEHCRSCRDELGALRRFSPEAIASAVAPPQASPWRRLRELLAPLGRLAWQPGFAYLLVGLLLLPAIYGTLERSEFRSQRELSADSIDSLAPAAPRTHREPVAEEDLRAPAPAVPRPLRELGAGEQEPVLPPSASRTLPQLVAKESDRARPSTVPRARREPVAEEDLRAPAPTVPLPLREQAAGASTHTLPPAQARARIESEAPALGEQAAAKSARPLAPAPAPAKDEVRAAKPALIWAARPIDEDLPLEARLSAAAAAEAAGAPAASAREPLRLQSGRTVEVATGEVAGGLRLLVPLPAAAAEAGEAEIRVSDPTGRRQLRELRAVAPAAHSLEIDVPVDWLAPGVFRVEIRSSRPEGYGGEPETYAFRVRGSPE
jgi:hypothetical protein